MPNPDRVLDAARRGDPAVDTCLLPSVPKTTELLLMPDDLRPLNFKWAFLFDLLSPEHRNPVDAQGQCFRNLVVGEHLPAADQLETLPA